MTVDVLIKIPCVECSVRRASKPTPRGEPRTPTGWHRTEDGFLCPLCWQKDYVLRAISVPVASPVDSSWEDVRHSLKAAWALTTSACNRIMTELYAHDVRRKGQEKCPPMPRIYLYPELRMEFPGLPSQTVATLEQTCQRKYRAVRYDVIWTAKAALPSFRYPTPYPIPNQGWTVSLEDGRPIVSFRLGDNRVRLRLKTGNQLRRQLEQIRQIVAGDAVKGEAAVYERGGVLMVKLVAWLPRPATNQGTGMLTVRTGPDCLLMAVNIKDEALWRYNGDHLRRWTAEHRRVLQRWSDDSKYENRPIPSFAERRKAAVAKYRRRMESATHEISSQLAGYATRRHFAAVYFDERDHSYLGGGFPWFRLREMMKEKLDFHGIIFTVASGDAVEQTQEPLTEEQES